MFVVMRGTLGLALIAALLLLCQGQARAIPTTPTLAYSTFLGGDGQDIISAVATDAAGNIYVAGSTYGSTFPGTPPRTFNNHFVAFVCKLNASGTTLVYSILLGGGYDNRARAIAVDAEGNAYVTGSTSGTFPTTPGAYRTTPPGSYDAFVVKLSPTGSLVYSTFLGGNNNDNGNGIAVDASGCAYIVGDTLSTDFPVVAAAQPVKSGSTDAFVTKINSSGTGLVYSTYLGGTNGDKALAVALGLDAGAYVTGNTPSANFPIRNAFRSTLPGFSCAFVTHLAPDGSLAYSTYLGGSAGDVGNAIAVDSSGSAYVTGSTTSTNFPVVNALKTTNSSGDAFLSKLSPAGNALLYSTYIGGSSGDVGYGVTTDNAGNAFVAGATSSANFPVTTAGFQRASGGLSDAFLTEIDTGAAGVASLLYSTYVGGTGNEHANAAAFHAGGDAVCVLLVGDTNSTNFPTLGAYQPAFGSMYSAYPDGFVSRFSLAGIPGNESPTVATAASATPNPVGSRTTNLSVLGADDGGEANLIYTWSATGPAAVTFSANGTNAAKNTTATFGKAGAYTFTVSIRDAGGLTASSGVNVTVNQTATALVVTPSSTTIAPGATLQFAAVASDQFGAPLAVQPAFTWSVSGGGTISSTGLFAAAGIVVRATGGGLSGTAAVTIAP